MKLNQSGQSLLEMTIAMGIALIVLSTMTIITLTGLKNSQYSQNVSNATKLAQDGLEQVRALKDRNEDGSVCVNNSVYNFTKFWGYTCSGNSCVFKISSSGICSFYGASTASPYLQISPTGEVINSKFTRKIIIQDDNVSNPNVKNVTAQVSWNDSSGLHQINLSTIISNPNTQVPIY